MMRRVIACGATRFSSTTSKQSAHLPLLFSTSSRFVSTDQNKTNVGQDPVYMYATKDNADPRNEADPLYGRKRAKLIARRLWGDPALRLMLVLTTIILGASFVFFDYTKKNMMSTKGLIGPKWKKFRSRLTIVLDLDETMVSYGDKAYRLQTALVQRPYLAEFLDYCASIDAEVVVWTAGSERYLRDALQQVDPMGNRVSRTIARDPSWFTGDNYFEKNVLWLNRNLNDTLMVENRAVSVRSCNYNTVLVPDFIRGEFMESGQDFPPNDQCFKHLKEIVEDLEISGKSVPLYLADKAVRHKEIRDIPCHLAIRQLEDELAKGTFFYICDKFSMDRDRKETFILGRMNS